MLFLAGVAQGRGLYLEFPPWYSPALADTNLTFGAGMVYVRADTQAVLFPVVLTPIRRGPLRFAATWSYVSVRTVEGRVFGFGDPKVFARLRLAGAPDAAAVLFVEGAARLPTAQPKLFPFATGGQEVELAGTLGVPRLQGLHVGGGGIWTEPPGHSSLQRRDLPHAVHAWALVSHARPTWAATLREDELWMHGGTRRSGLEASVTMRTPGALRVSAGFRLEMGPRRERVVDRAVSLRFATSLR